MNACNHMDKGRIETKHGKQGGLGRASLWGFATSCKLCHVLLAWMSESSMREGKWDDAVFGYPPAHMIFSHRASGMERCHRTRGEDVQVT